MGLPVRAALYQGNPAALVQMAASEPSDNIIKRTGRFIRGLKKVRAKIASNPYCSAENKRELYSKVFHGAWSPVFDVVHNAADTFWSFLFRLWYDTLGVLVFIINTIVKLVFYIAGAGIFLWDRLWDFRLWVYARKKTLFQIFTAAVAIVVLGVMTINLLTAYEYSYFGRTLGTVKTKQEVYSTVALIGDKLSDSTGANVNLDAERDIQFKRVFGLNFKFDSKDDILNTLTYMKDIQVTAYAIRVDGVDVVVLDNEAAARSVIEDLKTSFTPKTEGLVYDDVSFGQEVKVEEVTVKLGTLWRPDDAAKYLKTGTVSDLSEGDVPDPVITVYSTGTLTSYEEIAYETTYIEDDTLYLNEMEEETEGQPGVNMITAQVDLVNGVEVSRIERSNVTISEPVDAVYRRGTKDIPAVSGSGTWMFPLKSDYRLTSPYGGRTSLFAGMMSNHEGNDFACYEGTPIYASDGGVVTWAGARSTYGMLVEISHGNGYTTLYAHCSAILVTVGQEVQQGEMIARVGHTGAASGSHLHFEARYNGVAFDSLDLFR